MRADKFMRIEESITNWLIKNKIYPFSIVCTFAQRDGLVSITFFHKIDLRRFLNFLDYDTLCDKSGIEVYEKDYTVVVSEMSLLKLYSISYV